MMKARMRKLITTPGLLSSYHPRIKPALIESSAASA
jgi:hypothetical protein